MKIKMTITALKSYFYAIKDVVIVIFGYLSVCNFSK